MIDLEQSRYRSDLGIWRECCSHERVFSQLRLGLMQGLLLGARAEGHCLFLADG